MEVDNVYVQADYTDAGTGTSANTGTDDLCADYNIFFDSW